MLAPAARGPSHTRDPSAAVEGEESALGQERGKDEPHNDDNSNATTSTSTNG